MKYTLFLDFLYHSVHTIQSSVHVDDDWIVSTLEPRKSGKKRNIVLFFIKSHYNSHSWIYWWKTLVFSSKNVKHSIVDIGTIHNLFLRMWISRTWYFSLRGMSAISHVKNEIEIEHLWSFICDKNVFEIIHCKKRWIYITDISTTTKVGIQYRWSMLDWI